MGVGGKVCVMNYVEQSALKAKFIKAYTIDDEEWRRKREKSKDRRGGMNGKHKERDGYKT